MIRFAYAAIPVIASFLVAAPIAWAYPDGLPVWRSVGIVLGWGWYGPLDCVTGAHAPGAQACWCAGRAGRMYRWHHGLGLTAYIVLLLHPLALRPRRLERSAPAGLADVIPR